ncbi:MAG: hypothetical protein ACEPOZ_20730 [Marinifilaceae bacterium]
MFLLEDKKIKILLVSITVVVLSPTFFNDFQLEWDDNWMLLENPFVRNFSWNHIWYHFLHFYKGQYSPVNTVLYGMVYSVFGFNPVVYHFFCLLLHLLSALCVYQFVKECVRKIKPNYELYRVNIYAGVVALFFGIHPLQVESVAWISASKVVLFGFFTMFGLLMYIKFILERKWWMYGCVVLVYLLAFGSKEQAIIFPLLLLVVDWLFGRCKSNDDTCIWHNLWLIVEKMPFFVLALGMWYFSLQHNLGGIEMLNTYPFDQRLFFGCHSLVQYIFRFLAPIKLNYFYCYPIEVGDVIPFYYWIYPLLVLIIFLFTWYNYKQKNQLVVFGVLFFLINLLLVLHIIPMPRKMITADRYIYLSVIGISLVLVCLLDDLFHRFSKQQKWIIVSMVLFFIVIGSHSFFRTNQWKNSNTIKQNRIIKEASIKQRML